MDLIFFIVLQFVLFFLVTFLYDEFFTFLQLSAFWLALVTTSLISVIHVNSLIKNNVWTTLEDSYKMSLIVLLYALLGFIFWHTFLHQLLMAGCQDILKELMLATILSAFAITLFGGFYRSFLIAIFLPVTCSCLILYVKLGAESYLYIVQIFIGTLCQYTLLRVQNQRLLGTLAVQSQNHELFDTLKQKNLELAHLNTSQSRYLSAASHDLRQPLHALALINHDAQNKNRDPAIDSSLKKMEQAIDSLSKSFDAMLNLSRLDAGALTPRPHNIPIQRLLDRLIVEFEAAAIEKNLRFSVVSSKAWVSADEGILYSILSNFVTNAIRYTEEGGVVIGIRRKGAYMIPCVYDSGVGVPAEQLEQIFNEYERLDYAHQRVTGGVGLGLAISERMIKLLKAKLVVHSTIGRGSVFGVQLPVAADGNPSTNIELGSLGLDYFAGKKAIILDDDALAAEKLEELLCSWGMIVSVALSIEMVTELIHDEGEIDLIISDFHLGMAQENGLDVILHAQKLHFKKQLHCILITGDTTLDLIESARTHDVHLLYKPVSPSRLRGFLNTLSNAAAH